MIESILIVADSNRVSNLLANICREVFSISATCCQFSEYFSPLHENCDLILFDFLLCNKTRLDSAIKLKTVRNQIIFLLPEDILSLFREKCRNLGIITLQKPLTRQDLLNALYTADSAFSAVSAALSELDRLNAKLDEIKLIERAKLLLMQYLRFSETESHRYIEKHAMDMRLSKKQIALNIIKTYAN